MGGRNAALHTPRRFDFNIVSYFQKGGYDDAIIYDSTGHEYEVVAIELRRPSSWHYFLRRADYLFVLPDPDKEPMARLDMELRETGALGFDAFCDELREIALAHPNWWKRHSTEEEIRTMFDGCSTFAEAIESIGALDPPGRERLKGKSEKIVDLR